MPASSYYPAFLNLKGKKCIVIGGGKVAERKAASLLRSGAELTVISPELTARLKKEKAKKRINHVARKYQKGDLKNAFLVIAATASHEINKRASVDAPALINVVDTPGLCNFIVPSVVRRGPLTIAISTSGVSPAIAKKIRKELEKLYGSRVTKHLNALKKMRTKVLSEVNDKEKRERLLKKLAENTWGKLG